MAPSVPNQNWPTLFAEGLFGANPFFGTNPNLIPNGLPWTSLTDRLYPSWSIRMGKQFELDLVQPGEFHGSWVNKDGFLDPSNTASPLATYLLPYRGYRKRAQWPPSVNLITADQATGGEGTPLAVGTLGAPYGVRGGYFNITVQTSGTAFQGTQVWGGTGTTGSTGGTLFSCVAAGVAPLSGATFTLTIHARSVTSSANPQVQPFVQWRNAAGTILQTDTGGTVTLTGSPSAAWTTITFTTTMPTSGTAVAAVFGLTLTSNPAGTWSFQADGLQWEQGSSASPFTVPGTNYPLYYGMPERYPQTWEYTGTYGLVQPVGVDGMTTLSQTVLPAAFIADVLALNPNFFYALNDPTGSTSCADTAAKRPPAPVENSPYGVGSLTFGSSITSATAGQGFTGTPGPVSTFNNPVSGSSQSPATYVSIHRTTAFPGPPSNGNFTRIVHFRTTSSTLIAWSAHGTISSSTLRLRIVSGSVDLWVGTGTGTASRYQAPGTINDGNWHQIGITVDGSGNTSFYIDGVQFSANNGFTSVSLPFVTPMTDVIGAEVDLVGDVTSSSVGDVALAFEIGSVLTPSQVSNLYTSWRNAWSGDSSGARYSRILNWAGYVGASSVDTGATASLGPATDVVGIDALTALQDVVTTENGNHFVAGDGTVTFQARTRRYGQLTPTYVFGDAVPPTSEIPYESVDFDFDTTHVSNNVTVTQVSSNQNFYAKDSTSQSTYGSRNLARNNQSTSSNECQDAANYLMQRYKDARLRVAKLKIHTSSNPPVLFPVCLSLTLGMRVRVMRRPPSPAATIQFDGFIEQITHTADDKGDWTTELQISPADLNTYWQLSALHTTLHATAPSGTNTAVINALPDAAVNKLAQSLPSGYSLTFEPGTAREETLALAAGGIPSTSLGYTSATLTFTTNFTFTHNSGTVVCEPLPAGFTDPTTWDSASVLGAAYATVSSGGASGTNTVTITPLGDGSVNAFSSDFVAGDTLWLSPGTANFETAVISSIATSVPGYSTVQITFTGNLAHSHSVGDYVCEPLPGGQTNPATLTPTPTAKLAY